MTKRHEILLLVAMLLVAFVVKSEAQESFRVFPYAGLGWSTNQVIKKNWQVGLDVAVPLEHSARWYALTGLGYGRNMRMVYYPWEILPFVQADDRSLWEDRGVYYYYWYVPLHVGHHIKIDKVMSVMVDGGPYMNIGNRGSICINNETSGVWYEKYHTKESQELLGFFHKDYDAFSSESFLRRTELGLGLNVRMVFAPSARMSAVITGSMRQGITDQLKSDSQNMPSHQEYEECIGKLGNGLHSLWFGLSIGCSFRL